MSVEKGLFCGSCKQECRAIVNKDTEVDHAWGQTMTYDTYEIESDCCHFSVYTRREATDPEEGGEPEYEVWQEAMLEDCE